MEQVPLVHVTWDPAPTAAVHDFPPHVTWQFAPQLPLQVESAAQSY